ncbi:MAG: class II fructose-bisphosphate aldolase [Oscillospiraceae bacterium]|nr:class II fructose-bisphosphate aldolase [Oscillospiraceae bacterium]
MKANEAVRRAMRQKIVIPAFNIPYLPMVEPVSRAIVDENAVAMVQVARLEWEKFESESPEAVAKEYFRHCKEGWTLLHLDHVPAIDEDRVKVDFLPILKRALDAGYQSVMVDGSRLPLEENIAVTQQAAGLAAGYGAAVEAELGAVAGHEGSGIGLSYEELFASKKGFTRPEEATRFAKESGCDWLSVAVGSFHGAIATSTKHLKKPEARLDIDHLARLFEAVDHMPLVLHGGSGIRQTYILQAMENGIAKINVATEIRQPYEFALEEKPGDIAYARQKVYDRTRWVLRDFLRVSGSHDILN